MVIIIMLKKTILYDRTHYHNYITHIPPHTYIFFNLPDNINKDFRRVAISRVPPMKEMVLNKSKRNRIIIIH